MPLEATLLKTPYELSFTGNPLPFGFVITPYGASQRSQDIRLQIRVLVEISFNSDLYREVKSQQFYPDNEGLITVDVQTYIDPYLEYFLPKPTQTTPVQAQQQRRRYKISYLLQQGSAVVGTVQDSPVFTAIKGGMAYDQWHPSEFFTDYLFTGKNFLSFNSPGEKYALDELRYLFFVAPAAGTYSVKITTTDDAAGNANFGFSQTIVASKYSVWCIPSGYNQIPVLAVGPTWVVSYLVLITGTANAIIFSKKYITDYRNFYKTYQLLYRNSAGGLETIRLRGQVDFEADYNRQQAQRMVPPAYFNNDTLIGQVSDTADESQKYKGDTGFVSQAAAEKLRDLFVSPEKYEYTGGKLLPVTLNSKNVKFFSNKDNLISVLIEWQRAYVNSFFTPAGIMPVTRICPAVAAFSVKQINKFLLQISYALASPYDAVQVEIIIGTTTYNYTYTGNMRTVQQTFANPATTTPVNITVKARTVCDAQTQDFGAFTTLTLSVSGNSPVVAVDDNYSIGSGYNSAVTLAGSVLANDYDPDGDPIEAVAGTFTTNAGGSVTMNAAGVVNYLPPSSSFTGPDYFDYTAREVGATTGVTARVYINVGGTPGGSTIYAKVALRNVTNNNTSTSSQSSGEFWLEFYSNPGASQPVDVTGLNIIFNTKETFSSNGSTQVYNNPIVGTGTKVKLKEGIFFHATYPPGQPFTIVQSDAWEILAGTGYTAI